MDFTYTKPIKLVDLYVGEEEHIAPSKFPNKISYMPDMLDFDFINKFMKNDYVQYCNLHQDLAKTSFVLTLLTKPYMMNAFKIMNILLVCANVRNGNLFAVICSILYWKWDFRTQVLDNNSKMFNIP